MTWEGPLFLPRPLGYQASPLKISTAPGGFPTLPNGVTFTGVTLNGHPLGFYHPAKLTSAGFVPGPLHGGTFTITHT
jgi:hypothetical protein